jgi:hypothetical protein
MILDGFGEYFQDELRRVAPVRPGIELTVMNRAACDAVNSAWRQVQPDCTVRPFAVIGMTE